MSGEVLRVVMHLPSPVPGRKLEECGSKPNRIQRFFSLTRRRLCALGVETGRSVATPLNGTCDFGSKLLEKESSSCWCGCGRRHLIASVLGTMLATTGDMSIATAASQSSNDYLRTLESFHPKKPEWYEEFFAELLQLGSYEAKVATYKTELFNQLKHSETSKTVLELGVGTGPNFQYYAKKSGINVIGLDPNESMEKYALAAAFNAGLGDAQFEFIHGVGEQIPLPSLSVDSVISTLVLCSVKDIASTLREVQRVLKPGGTLYFVEHVAAQEGTSLKFWQDVLNPVQELLADGCHLNRDTFSYLQAASFESVSVQSISINDEFLIAPHVVGTAQSAKI